MISKTILLCSVKSISVSSLFQILHCFTMAPPPRFIYKGRIFCKIFCKSLTGAWPYIFQLMSKPVLPSYTAEVFSYEILAFYTGQVFSYIVLFLVFGDSLLSKLNHYSAIKNSWNDFFLIFCSILKTNLNSIP